MIKVKNRIIPDGSVNELYYNFISEYKDIELLELKQFTPNLTKFIQLAEKISHLSNVQYYEYLLEVATYLGLTTIMSNLKELLSILRRHKQLNFYQYSMPILVKPKDTNVVIFIPPHRIEGVYKGDLYFDEYRSIPKSIKKYIKDYKQIDAGVSTMCYFYSEDKVLCLTVNKYKYKFAKRFLNGKLIMKKKGYILYTCDRLNVATQQEREVYQTYLNDLFDFIQPDNVSTDCNYYIRELNTTLLEIAILNIYDEYLKEQLQFWIDVINKNNLRFNLDLYSDNFMLDKNNRLILLDIINLRK